MSKAIIRLCLLLFASFLFNCNHKNDTKHWSYSGESSPEHWAEIARNGFCDGKHQSPINIIKTNTAKQDSHAGHLQIFYAPETKISKVENNGHSIQFDFEKGDSLLYKDQIYQLVQLHFHEPSEHTINGLRYPIELHFVHYNKQIARFTVLSVLGIEGKQSHCFEFFKHFLPIKNGETKEVEMSHDLNSLFPSSGNYFSYSGSLTTPPCTENVNWLIFEEAIELSEEEVIAFKENMPLDNYRNQQALNERKVQYVIN